MKKAISSKERGGKDADEKGRFRKKTKDFFIEVKQAEGPGLTSV
jgi:hypothetical protein